MSVARVSRYFPARFITAPTKYAEEFAVALLIVLESRELFCESLNGRNHSLQSIYSEVFKLSLWKSYVPHPCLFVA